MNPSNRSPYGYPEHLAPPDDDRNILVRIETKLTKLMLHLGLDNKGNPQQQPQPKD